MQTGGSQGGGRAPGGSGSRAGTGSPRPGLQWPQAAVVGFTGTPREPSPSPRRWPYLPSSSPRGSTSSGGSTGIGCGGAGRSGSRGWTCGQDRAGEAPARRDAMLPGVPAPHRGGSATHLPTALGQSPSPPSVATSAPAAAVPRRPPACRHRRSQAARRCYGNSDCLRQGLPLRAASDAQGCRKAGETPGTRGSHPRGRRGMGAGERCPASRHVGGRRRSSPQPRRQTSEEFQLFPTGPGLPPRC